MFILIMTLLVMLASSFLFLIAKSGIKHYFSLYRNENDAKKLNLLTLILFLIIFVGSTLICTYHFNKMRYNSEIQTEVKNGVRR
jgi:uncharacterized membrane protein